MRLLMFHVESFWFRLDELDDDSGSRLSDSILVWIHSESEDEKNESNILRKMVKNIRWLANKVGCTSIILHPFAHLDDDKADPEFASGLITETAKRLIDREYAVTVVPFGHFTEFELHAKGPSLGKVFKHIT